MARDPWAAVRDAPLFVVPRVLDGLRAYRATFAGLPGNDAARLTAEIDGLQERLLTGIEGHPTKSWVLKQLRKTLDAVGDLEPAARGQVRVELERLMDILGIASADGALGEDFR
ncbi:DUF4844 domain-containing protein [Massilia niabensis]|uniref:DUF4844 domain-containing protein n=1 Tax=Massilia niabensis TaxID=544910 RepID=A0ABW0L319_9BURK